VAREGRGRRGLGVPRQPDQAAHGLQGLDRVWPLQDDDDRARQVQGAIQYHRANVRHSYETVITDVGREMLAKAKIAFGLGIVENGYDETAHVEAFGAADLEAGERRLLKTAKENLARLPFSALEC